ncbi:hypothetical protein VFPBJ_00439 [Purpureocillium lilacinum]|uniref:Uncharacterized protein n=1 Tax=Purpureocillium lilacinum TaxID=33203 RepID=A0A179HAD7_PURLI|nr:hypothetical protein VFPBJ_00439 [Purpureocillium lilacinum]
MEENSRPHTIGCRAYDRLAIEPCPSTHPATPAHSIARQLPRGWLPESFAGKAPEATDSWASIDGDGGVGLRQLRWSPGILSCLGRPVPSLFSALLTWLRLLGLLLPLPARIMAATRAGHDVRWESAMSARRQWRTWPSLPILAADGLRPWPQRRHLLCAEDYGGQCVRGPAAGLPRLQPGSQPSNSGLAAE